MKGDHLEAKLNEDLQDEGVGARFNAVLGLCASLALHFPRLATAGPETYEHLLTCLRLVRDV